MQGGPEEPGDQGSGGSQDSALCQLKRKLEDREVLTGNLRKVSYVDGPRSASYQIRLTTRSAIRVQITINGPYGSETEEAELDSESGEPLRSRTNEPEYLMERVTAAIYHAIGLPPSYWEPAADVNFDTGAAAVRAFSR